MADPVVTLTNGVPTSGSGVITTLGQTLVDGANATLGANADAAVTAGAAGSLSAKLRSISRDIVANISLAASSAIIGLVKLTDGTNTAAVKAASTAPAATDPAVVVAMSPNAIALGSGATSATTQRVVIASDQAQAPGVQVSTASTSIVPASDSPAFRMSQDTNALLNGNTALTPKFAALSASASGNTSAVALVSSKKLRVLSLKLTANGAVNVKWQSNTTDKTGLSYFAAAGDGEVLPFNPLGWFETAAGETLNINLSAAVAVGGHLTYVEV